MRGVLIKVRRACWLGGAGRAELEVQGMLIGRCEVYRTQGMGRADWEAQGMQIRRHGVCRFGCEMHVQAQAYCPSTSALPDRKRTARRKVHRPSTSALHDHKRIARLLPGSRLGLFCFAQWVCMPNACRGCVSSLHALTVGMPYPHAWAACLGRTCLGMHALPTYIWEAPAQVCT